MPAKKKRLPAKKKPAVRRPKTQEEHLEILIMFSERAITNQGNSIDEFFRQQADRLKKQLEELRGK